MPSGQLELLSTDFALGWASTAGGRHTFVYATLKGQVIGVAEANISRPDLELWRITGDLEAYAYLIVFRMPVDKEQVASVEVMIVGQDEGLKRSSAFRQDRFPKLQLFVVGSPRSGTSELGNTLASKLHLPWLGEGHAAPLFAEAQRALWGDSGSDNKLVRYMASQDINHIVIDATKSAYYFMHESASFIDKTPGIPMITATPFLAKCFPEARFVCLIRNGISNVLSRLVKFGGSFEENCADWAAALDNWAAVRQELPHYVEVRQEDMLSDPDGVAEALAGYIGLPEVAGRLAASLQTGTMERTGAGIGRNRLDQTGWSADQVSTFRRVCGPTMERFGYSMA